MNNAKVIVGNAVDVLRTLEPGLARTCVTSPPYWGLRDYGQEAQLGLEDSPEAFIENLCLVFDEVWRVLADDGTCWVNMGDSYFPHGGSRGNKTPAGDSLRGRDNNYQPAPKLDSGNLSLKGKDLVGIPWLFAFAMKSRGWYLRQDIIWSKPNPMPESVKDRCTKSHEYIFLFSKQPSYYYDHETIKEPAVAQNHHDATGTAYKAPGQSKQTGNRAKAGEHRFGGNKYGESDDPKHATKSGNVYVSTFTRNKRSVWTVPTRGYKEAHFATYPAALILPCVLAGSAPGDTVLDPFSGSGTTGMVALQNDRNYVGIELNPDYAALSENRISVAVGMFGTVIVS